MWFRRDLRLYDNRALMRAAELANGSAVHAIFAFSNKLVKASSVRRVSYLSFALCALDDSVGGRLNFTYGDPANDVVAFAISVGATHVLATREYTPLGRSRDERVRTLLSDAGITFEVGDSPYLVPPGKIARQSKGWYRVFTPFYRAVLANGYDQPLGHTSVSFATPQVRDDAALLLLGREPLFDVSMFPGDEVQAMARLVEFCQGSMGSYNTGRNNSAIDGTSRLSPALRFGILHPRQVADVAGSYLGGDDLIRQLIWRDFFAQVVLFAPETTWSNFDTRFDAIVEDDPTQGIAQVRFEAWKAGETGYPIVDAGMRQLKELGWLHNRVRMITASFLVKDLHISWRHGAQYFMDQLLDGDIASNNHSWQWVAGSGTDSSPYFRIFNPILQSKKFDPSGEYIRRWVPELRILPTKFVHEPWRAKELGLLDPSGYANRIVSHEAERRDSLDRYHMISGSQEPRP